MAVARGQRVHTPGFVLQCRARTDDGPLGPRVGFTCTKKVGNAVARNSAKRRLRALAHETLRPLARPGYDYVLIGRADQTARRPFTVMISDLQRALETLHGPGK